MSDYNIVSDRNCIGMWLVMKKGADFIVSSHDTYEAAEQAVRILKGSPEAWSNGKPAA